MFFNLVPVIGYWSLIFLSLIKLVKYNGVISKYFYFSLWIYTVGFLLLMLVIRLIQKKPLQWKWLLQLNNCIVLPLVFAGFVITFGVESYTFTNFIFSTFGINHYALIELLMLSFFFMALNLTLAQLKKWWQLLLLGSFLLISFFIYNYFYPLFTVISLNSSGANDDNFMEWLQVAVLMVGVIISWLLAFKYRAKKLLALVFILASILFFGLIGEEISWGERIFDLNFEIQENNYQGELNLHNQAGFNELAALMYYVVFAYAAVSFLIKKFAEKRDLITEKYQLWWKVFTFRGAEIAYLIPTFIFNPYADRTLFPGYPSVLNIYDDLGVIPDFFQTLSFLAHWRETFEVLFYAALVLHFLHILLESGIVKSTKVPKTSKIYKPNKKLKK